MRKALKVVVVLLALGLIAVGVYFYRVMPRIPDRPFAKPDGPYAVGTRDYDWIDTSRAEQYTRSPDDRRLEIAEIS